jgi:hypothetical protein
MLSSGSHAMIPSKMLCAFDTCAEWPKLTICLVPVVMLEHFSSCFVLQCMRSIAGIYNMRRFGSHMAILLKLRCASNRCAG